MKTLGSALWWSGIAWIAVTVLVFAKVFLLPELVVSTPFSEPIVNTSTTALLLGSLAVLFFVLPPVEPIALLVIGMVAAIRSWWRGA